LIFDEEIYDCKSLKGRKKVVMRKKPGRALA
jgi:hypothetical protein